MVLGKKYELAILCVYRPRCSTTDLGGPNKGSAGVDEISLKEFDKDLSKNLYKIWNRIASGSYFPMPVKSINQ
jgi:hypothetical protein